MGSGASSRGKDKDAKDDGDTTATGPRTPPDGSLGEDEEYFWEEEEEEEGNFEEDEPLDEQQSEDSTFRDINLNQPVKKSRFADAADDAPRRRRRGSMADGPECLQPFEKLDPYKDLVQYQLYYRSGVTKVKDKRTGKERSTGKSKDPFAFLSNDWLEGNGMKEQEFIEGDIQPDAPDEAEETELQKEERLEAEEAGKKQQEFREDEILRMEELVQDHGDGWKLWLRGRDLRSEFTDQTGVRQATKRTKHVLKEKGNRRPCRFVNGKSWILAPIDARDPKGEKVCWLKDFVKEAKVDADILGLERPTIAAEMLRDIARKDWDNIDKFYWHLETVDLDGNRELWSPTFIAYLWEYWQRSDFGDHACVPENRLLQMAQRERLKGLQPDGLSNGLFPRKPVEWPKPIWKPPKMKVPEAALPPSPALPPFPIRLQHHNGYKAGHLERTLERHLAGTEAWDAMVGRSDRLQAAARSVLMSEKMEDAATARKEELKAKKAAEAAAKRKHQETARRKRERNIRRAEAARLRKEQGLPPGEEEPSTESETEAMDKTRRPEQVTPGSKYRTKKMQDVEELRKATAKAKPKNR